MLRRRGRQGQGEGEGEVEMVEMDVDMRRAHALLAGADLCARIRGSGVEGLERVRGVVAGVEGRFGGGRGVVGGEV